MRAGNESLNTPLMSLEVRQSIRIAGYVGRPRGEARRVPTPCFYPMSLRAHQVTRLLPGILVGYAHPINWPKLVARFFDSEREAQGNFPSVGLITNGDNKFTPARTRTKCINYDRKPYLDVRGH